MSDDKQLTVAELLARAGKEDSDADGTRGGRARSGKEGSEKPRRRRRRSMEDGGGVSVAELTGSFPKVKAKPKESKRRAGRAGCAGYAGLAGVARLAAG